MEKVVVGMSGGVDSSVCAYLLKQQGYDVTGITLRLWDDEEDVCRRKGHIGCCGSSAVEDAKNVCARLGIPFHVYSMQEVFREKVVSYFCQSYVKGHTPNPCIMCNRYLKWGAMLDKARELGADYIATGHYAKIQKFPNGCYAVVQSEAGEKDQTYVLYSLTQEQLSHTLMPLGSYHKQEVRKLAGEAGLLIADKRDSQDICFVPDGDYNAFLERQLGKEDLPPPGNFVMRDGTVVGRHKGITHYTIGQRKGLGIALNERVFVNRICADRNEVVIGKDEECFSLNLKASQVNHMGVKVFDEQTVYVGKIRYSDSGTPCRVSYLEEDDQNGIQIEVKFLEPVRAITLGQAVVLYDGDVVAGGGIISESQI